jgi:NAD(P)H-dependent flavin oxidoreductase YrpB (nitropropane dioxygenase family)
VASILERLGIEVPIVQAGMGGGIAGHELAAAVSGAGGLGTIGLLGAPELGRELEAARAMLDPGRPVAINLLLPFARRAHFDIASGADVLVTFWGEPRRATEKIWIHQCGSVQEALAARTAGADAVIAQGLEAGGHVRSRIGAVELLHGVRRALGDAYPVLSAGGIATREDVVARLDQGADAVVCGTRFLLSDECRAHPEYKERLLTADRTLLTELFGVGWPAPHRVVPNAATDRWLDGDRRGPAWLRALHRATAPALSRAPLSLQLSTAAMQSPGRPLFSPVPATAEGPSNLIDAGPLYAGESVARISDIRPAAELVRELRP